MTTSCESCGADDPELVAVHRRYLALPNGNTEDRIVRDVERWCVACLTHYPHVLADDD